jgi:hypothetical protein
VIAESDFPKDDDYRLISGSQRGKRLMFTPPTRSKEPSDYLTVPLRIALGLSFLFPVADRLGILGPPGTAGVTWGNFANFLRYNALIFARCYSTNSWCNCHSS